MNKGKMQWKEVKTKKRNTKKKSNDLDPVPEKKKPLIVLKKADRFPKKPEEIKEDLFTLENPWIIVE